MKMPAALQKAVIDGLTRLMALRLRGAPSAENIQQTAAVWIDALDSKPIGWDVELDLPRIVAAFRTLTSTAKWWPAPADLIEAMPQRVERVKLNAPVDRTMSANTRRLLDGLKATLRGGRA